MGNMYNYYEQLMELRIAEERLESLIEKKEMLKSRIMKITSQMKDIMVTGGSSSDKMVNYVIAIEGVDRKIEEVTEEIRGLKKGLGVMEEIFNNYKDDSIERSVFELIYIQNKKVSEAANIIPCDRRTVYRYKKIIDNKILQKSESCHKMSQKM